MIHIIQALCPFRHVIIATLYDPANSVLLAIPGLTAAEAFQCYVETALHTGQVSARCGICGACKFTYEDRETPFATLQEATPHMQELVSRKNAELAFFAEHRN